MQFKTLMDKILAMSYYQGNLLNGLMTEIFVCLHYGNKEDKNEKNMVIVFFVYIWNA